MYENILMSKIGFTKMNNANLRKILIRIIMKIFQVVYF